MTRGRWASANQSRDRVSYEVDQKDAAARVLDCRLDPEPMIRGMTDVDRIRAWTEVAADLNQTDVVARLNERLREVQES